MGPENNNTDLMIVFINHEDHLAVMFAENEKVFSLSGTADAVPSGDITQLFQELYCYLLVAGFYREGEDTSGVHWVLPSISDPNFEIPSGCYRPGLARQLTKGLKARFAALSRKFDLSPVEKDVLVSLDYIFVERSPQYARLSARSLLSIAYSRSFSPEMIIIAHYVAVTFGQIEYPDPLVVPQLYLSVFGNIHLRQKDPALTDDPESWDVVLHEPTLRYGSVVENNDVTALWSFMSAQTNANPDGKYLGDALGDRLAKFSFLAEKNDFEKSIPIPRYAASLCIQRMMGIEGCNPVNTSVVFFQQFLYGSLERLTISRQSLLSYVINDMMEKMGETHFGHLFSPNSFYRKLAETTTIYGKTTSRPLLLQFALEALDADQKDDKASDSELSNIDELAEGLDDPSEMDHGESSTTTEPGGYDPSLPPPAVPAKAEEMDKDTIDLISFDKTGEGVNEDLYRRAVVALNDRLRNDDTIPITAQVKESLDWWVNGFLYLTAISATKDQINSLKLQQYLKPVSK